MTHQERDRLGISLVLALLIHAVIIVWIGLTDWQVHEFPEARTVFVDLLEYTSAPPVDEPVVEPEEVPVEPVPDEPAEVITEPVEPEPVEPEPVEPEPEVRPVEQAATPATQSAPVVRESAAVNETAAPRETVDFVAGEPLVGIPSDRADNPDRVPVADIFAGGYDEPVEDGQLPDWIDDGPIPELRLLDAEDQARLADKQATVPGFGDILERVFESLNATPSTVQPGASSDTTSQTSSTSTITSGGTAVTWSEGGDRGPIGFLARPDLQSSDFGGLVPTTSFVIVFDVNADGLIVPGSVIMTRPSGSTAADQKVIAAVRTWRFQPAPGSGHVTAVATIPLERENGP